MTNTDYYDPEQVIREYLLFLDDPEQLKDENEVQRLTAVAAETTDPIERLRALTDLSRATQIDGTYYKDNFVAVALEWANANDVGWTAFSDMGVPKDVLAEAGFEVPVRKRSAATRVVQVIKDPDTTRAAPVNKAVIKEAAMQMVDVFTLSDLREKVGGSPMTIRAAIDELVAENLVLSLGPDPEHQGKGRAPFIYQVNEQ